MNRRGFLKKALGGIAAVPAVVILGEGLVANTPEATKGKYSVGEFTARFSVEDGEFQTITIPVLSNIEHPKELNVDYIALILGEPSPIVGRYTSVEPT